MFSTKSEILNIIEEYKVLEVKRYKLLADCSNLVRIPKSYDVNTEPFMIKSICLEELKSLPQNKELINFAQEVLAKDINQYINKVNQTFKHLILLPKAWDENTSLDIIFLDFIIFVPEKKIVY
jgi:hypothetical protein